MNLLGPEGPSFQLLRRPPNTRITPLARTYTASTGSSGRSTRQYPNAFVPDIPRRIDVPIMVRAAMGTRPRPDIERHLVADRTALGARLRTRIPAVAPNERLAGARRLVLDEAGQHAPARVSRGFREAVVRHYPFHMQVFDGDDLVFVYDPSRQLVQVVSPGARDALMCSRHQSPGLVPAVRSFLFAGQRPLFALQVLFRLAQMAGVLELRSVAGDSEMGQPDVDADRLTLGGHRRQRLSVIGQDGRMELTAGVAADCDGLDRARDLTMHDALNPADLRQIDARAFELHPLRILDGLPTMLGFEARIFAAFLEEVLKRPRQILQGSLQRLTVRIPEPFKLLLQLWKSDGHGVIVQPLARGAIEIARQGKRIVPCPPRAPELNGQGMGLFIGRVEANTGCIEHPLDIRCRCLRSKWPYIPALNGRVLRPKRIIKLFLGPFRISAFSAKVGGYGENRLPVDLWI